MSIHLINEWILSNEHNDLWVCACGNTPDSDGFSAIGTVRVHHTSHIVAYDDRYNICNQCGRIMDSTTHTESPMPVNYQGDWLGHKVRVVGFFPITSEMFEEEPASDPDKDPRQASIENMLDNLPIDPIRREHWRRSLLRLAADFGFTLPERYKA